MTSALIISAWIALNIGFAGGAAFVAHRQCGVQILAGKFLAEVATLMAGLSAVLWGLPFAARVWGIAP